jgi:hypothetical protein
VREQAGERVGHPQAPGKHLGDLAHRRHVRLEGAHGLRQPLDELQRPHRPRARRARQRAHDPAERLARGAEHDRRLVLAEVAAEELRANVGVGHACGMKQQARVVRLSQRVDIGAQALPEPRREQRALQAMLERQPHTEIGRQAEHADDLRGADSFGTRHSTCCHAVDATAARCPLPGTKSSAIKTPSRPQGPGPRRFLLLDESYGELSTSADRGAAAFAREAREGGVSVEPHDMLGKDDRGEPGGSAQHACCRGGAFGRVLSGTTQASKGICLRFAR